MTDTVTKFHVDYLADVDSSFIDKVGFFVTDASTRTGSVFVKIKDDVYRYDGTTYDNYLDLATAWSVGAEYHDFSHAHGPATEHITDGDIDVVVEDLRVKLDEEAVVSDEEAVVVAAKDFSVVVGEDSSGEEQADVLNFPAQFLDFTMTDEDRRRDSLGLAVRLHAGRGVSTSYVIETAEEFAEYLKNGS